MAGGTDGAETGRDPGGFASRNTPNPPGEDSLARWAGRYLDLAVRGARSAQSLAAAVI
jgi:hypothetical protein